MGNLTFLISAVITVFLLQGIEQTNLNDLMVSDQNVDKIVIKGAKSGEITLKSIKVGEPESIKAISVKHHTILTKS